MDESLRDRLKRGLPHIYKSPQNWQREWESLLKEELGSYLDQIEESIRGFASLRPVLLEFMAEYERDGTAERILGDYVEERLAGVPLHLLSEGFATPSRERRLEIRAVIAETGLEDDDNMDRMDRRSVTMAAEPISGPDTHQSTIIMAPPPRPSAPVAPMTPVTPFRSWRTSYIQAEAGPSRPHGGLTSPVLTEASRSIEKQTGKRPIDRCAPQEQQQGPQSPSKRSRTSSASISPQIPFDITREVDLFDVDEMEYMFKDARCGSGWLVIRCYPGKTQFLNPTARFLNHPLKNNLALDHFNQRLPCHPAPPKDKHTEATILQKFAWRVYNDVFKKVDPADKEVNDSNARLRKRAEEDNLPDIYIIEAGSEAGGKGKKKAAKGKTRIGGAKFHKGDTQETDDSYHEEHS